MMTRTAFMTLALIAIAFPAMAQDRNALCKLLPQKGMFNTATYIPGVDVHGNAVVSADLNEAYSPARAAAQAGEATGTQQVPSDIDIVTIPVTLDLAQGLAKALPAGTEMKAPVATVDIHKDGRVTYNGQDVSGNAYAMCGLNAPALPVKQAEAQIQPPAAPMVEQPSAAQAQETGESTSDLPRLTTTEGDIIWGEGN